MSTAESKQNKEKLYIEEFLHKPFLKPKIGIIIHTYGKTKPDFPLNKSEIADILGDDGIILETFSEKDIYHALAEFRYRKAPVVGFIGDNSSIHFIVNALIHLHGEKQMPLLVPLRGKNRSIIASDVKLDKDIGAILHKIKRKYILKKDDSVNFIERNTIKFTISENDDPFSDNPYSQKKDTKTANAYEYYGFVLSTGAVYRIMKLIKEGDTKIAKSVQSFSRTYLSLLFKGELADHLLSKDRCTLKLDGERINHPRSLITVISSLYKILNHYQPFTMLEDYESTRNAKFNFMSADLVRGDLLKSLPFLSKGKYGNLVKTGKVILQRVNEVVLETQSGIVLDGEVIKPYAQNKSYIIRVENGPLIKFPII